MSATSVSSARHAVSRRSAQARAARRVSGPSSGRMLARAAPEKAPTVGARALALVCALPNHSLLDRLVRGRAWIPVLGLLLAGVVTMQVEILKLGTSLGRSLAWTTTLQTQNESLQARVASLADDQRIERLASRMGMVMSTAGLLTFVHAHPQVQLGKAIANIHPPAPATFAAQLAARIASAALLTPAAPSATSGAGQTPTASVPAGSAASAAAAPTAPTTAASSTPTTATVTPTTTTNATPTVTLTTSADTGAAGLSPAATTGGTQGG